MALKLLLSRRFLYVLLAAAALAIVIIRFDVLDVFNTKISKEFRANLLEVKENSIIAEGAFVLSGDNALNSEQKSHKAEVLIDLDTKIIRSAFYLPKNDKMFIIGDLEKDIKEVDLDTFKNDFQNRTFNMSVVVKTDADVYGENKFRASEITYRLPLRK